MTNTFITANSWRYNSARKIYNAVCRMTVVCEPRLMLMLTISVKNPFSSDAVPAIAYANNNNNIIHSMVFRCFFFSIIITIISFFSIIQIKCWMETACCSFNFRLDFNLTITKSFVSLRQCGWKFTKLFQNHINFMLAKVQLPNYVPNQNSPRKKWLCLETIFFSSCRSIGKNYKEKKWHWFWNQFHV